MDDDYLEGLTWEELEEKKAHYLRQLAFIEAKIYQKKDEAEQFSQNLQHLVDLNLEENNR